MWKGSSLTPHTQRPRWPASLHPILRVSPSSTVTPPREPRPQKLPALGGEKAFVRTNRTGRALGPGLSHTPELLQRKAGLRLDKDPARNPRPCRLNAYCLNSKRSLANVLRGRRQPSQHSFRGSLMHFMTPTQSVFLIITVEIYPEDD